MVTPNTDTGIIPAAPGSSTVSAPPVTGQPPPVVAASATSPTGATPGPTGSGTPPTVSAPDTASTAPSGPYDLPPEFHAPQAPPAPTGPLSDAERQQLAYYRDRDQQNVLRDMERNVADYERQAYQHYLQQGKDEESARDLAAAHRGEYQRRLQGELELRSTLQAQQRVSQDAQDVARQFNVNPSVLAGFTNRADMARHAALVRHFGEYRQTIEKRLAAMEKARVPEQTFVAGGVGAPVPGASTYTQALKEGKAIPSAAEIDRITAKFARG